MAEPKDELILLCANALKLKGIDDEKHRARLKEELREVEVQEEHEYFLDLHQSKTKYPFNQNNLLIPFLLGIVDDFDINKEASYAEGEFPDVDVDYLAPIRDYLKNEWAPQAFGRDKVCNIGSYNTYGMKSSLIDMAKVFGQDRDDMLLISKSLASKDDEGEAMTWEKALEINPALTEFTQEFPDIFDATKRIHTRNKSMGKHAGGLVISSKPLDHLVPLVVDKDGLIQSAWTEGLNTQDLGPVGLVKYDLLVIANLMQIFKIKELVKRRHNLDSFCALPGQKDWSDTSYLNDEKALKMANDGDLKCIFQFDSPGIRRLVRDGGVTTFDDLVAYASLYRPGPLGMGMHTRYAARKTGKEQCFLPPCVEPILGDTYGVMVFQEQVMRILNIVGKIPMMHCVGVIKAISKKKEEVFVRYKDRFIKNGPAQLLLDVSPEPIEKIDKIVAEITSPEAAADYAFYEGLENPYPKAMAILAYWYRAHKPSEVKGLDRARLSHEVSVAYARYFWDQIEAFAGYGFNASHAVAYTYVSSRLLYLKAHYPLEFYAGILSCETDEDKIKEYRTDASIHNIPIEAVDINRSNVHFDIYEDGKPSPDDKIYFGLSNIKGIGDGPANVIVEGRPYNSFESFLEKFGTQATSIKPLLALRIFKDAPPDVLFKFYEEYKGIQKNRKDRAHRFDKKMAEYEEELHSLLEGCDVPVNWDEKNLEIYKQFDVDEVLEIRVDDPKDPYYGGVTKKKFNRYNKLKSLFRRRKQGIERFAEKERISDENPFTLAKFDPADSKIHIPAEFEEYWKFPELAEDKFLGFRWNHPLNKSPDFQGNTFASQRDSESPEIPVEVLVEECKRKEWRSGNGYSWKVRCQDANGEVQTITVWPDDYERFKEEFDYGLIRIKVKPPDKWGYSLVSPPKYLRHTLPSKEKDTRVVKLRKGNNE